jgi:hypothetical protein
VLCRKNPKKGAFVMSNKKIIAVVGATGAQGGGSARAILNDSDSPFVVRAPTRNGSSEKAQALAALGAEVVEADLDDGDSLKRAFAGAHGAFCVTNFWEHFSPEKEPAPSARHGGGGKGVWFEARHLVDARRHAPVGTAR